ncbi:DUF3055 domain-containing protein [Paenibacillus albiflavus]|uniref:DUF3055 domain-containing protein n=1 Tax=Paenibacillus albiflavus TaxID=2545760 RepID=A0A4R4E2B8_9BACL|nr:DUF3055 domain-containing protein [Paenibacillus albiflavus]TCZ73017.1 DUF3055 domain-containing protein [Paenibacillus albiflavus]
MSNFDFLYDYREETTTRFVCILGKSLRRFDLALMSTNSFFGKKIVIDLQSGRSAIIGPDDLKEEGYLEHVFKVTEEEAAELANFLEDIVGTVNFTDL